MVIAHTHTHTHSHKADRCSAEIHIKWTGWEAGRCRTGCKTGFPAQKTQGKHKGTAQAKGQKHLWPWATCWRRTTVPNNANAWSLSSSSYSFCTLQKHRSCLFQLIQDSSFLYCYISLLLMRVSAPKHRSNTSKYVSSYNVVCVFCSCCVYSYFWAGVYVWMCVYVCVCVSVCIFLIYLLLSACS